MNNYDYIKCSERHGEEIDALYNFAKKGWELVSVIPSGGDYVTMYLKRPYDCSESYHNLLADAFEVYEKWAKLLFGAKSVKRRTSPDMEGGTTHIIDIELPEDMHKQDANVIINLESKMFSKVARENSRFAGLYALHYYPENKS
jgi:hypothetical protein